MFLVQWWISTLIMYDHALPWWCDRCCSLICKEIDKYIPYIFCSLENGNCMFPCIPAFHRENSLSESQTYIQKFDINRLLLREYCLSLWVIFKIRWGHFNKHWYQWLLQKEFTIIYQENFIFSRIYWQNIQYQVNFPPCIYSPQLHK